jgi:hypothetical protein
MTARQFADWVLTLPPEVQNSELQSIDRSGIPFNLKRAVAYTYRDGTEGGVYVNAMGSHVTDDFLAETYRVGGITSDGRTLTPQEISRCNAPATPQRKPQKKRRAG